MAILGQQRATTLAMLTLVILFAPVCSTAWQAPQEKWTYPPYAAEPAGRLSTVIARRVSNGLPRTFELTSDAVQREAMPAVRRIIEPAGGTSLHTGSVLLDALFAMSLDDAKQDSVEAIRDQAYSNGAPIDCHCFQTGEKWTYVWTRDLSYSLDLGLAVYDPQRAVNSLLFKTSAFRPPSRPREVLRGHEWQIIQDTGSGGSWPVSTDRVVWALGAEAALANLQGEARAAFAAKSYQAIAGSLEADRIATWNARDGLYGGEHSFLDWREQTYASWITENLSTIAQMKALSTNVLEYRAMRLAAQLGRELGQTEARRYDEWADALGPRIAEAFWDKKAGLYATYLSADFHPALIEKYDLLGNDLAIVSGLADEKRARTILSRYPFAPFGPPVVWPEARDMFVYHNRAIWPFVTAYTLRAAAGAGHVAAADAATDSLLRGAALHLSNMENLEWLTGKSAYDDGPQINSPRQLWSVGGFYGAFVEVVFGWRPGQEGVALSPFLTTRMRTLMSVTASARLSGIRYQGRELEITLKLPAEAKDGGVYPVRRVLLNGKAVASAIKVTALTAGVNRIEVEFGPPRFDGTSVTRVPLVSPLSHNDFRAFMPATPPAPQLRNSGSSTELSWLTTDTSLRYVVRRNGVQTADSIAGARWEDRQRDESLTACYTLTAIDLRSSLTSDPSEPSCVRGSAADTILPGDARVDVSAQPVPPGDGVNEATWRIDAGTVLNAKNVRVGRAGTYAIVFLYDNHSFAHNTGITNAVKRLRLEGAVGHKLESVVQMPHIRAEGKTHPVRESTISYFRLEPGTYTLTLDDFFNMSAMLSNAKYSGPGGSNGYLNDSRIAEIRIDPVE